MRLHQAWIAQAASDLLTARALQKVGAHHCQVVAKCQQTMEKAVKGLVEALGARNLGKMQVDRHHDVAKYVDTLVFAVVGAPKEYRFLKGELPRLFPPYVKECIAALDKVVPEYPKRGSLAAKNTEYPFQLAVTDWLAPCDQRVFAAGDVRRYLAAAERVQGGAGKFISVLDRVAPLP